VLTLQGILQLKELEASHRRGHGPFGFPRAAAAHPWAPLPQQSPAVGPSGTQRPCPPPQSQPAARSSLPAVPDTVIKPTCPTFWKTFHFGR